MDEIKKMLREVINNQSAFRQEMFRKFDELEGRLTKRIDEIAKDLKYLTKRVDNLGKQQAYLEDNTPTREEFDILEKRVDKIENKTSAAL